MSDTNWTRFDVEKLSTPVPVSEGSQVSGEVGPATNGSNQIAATGAGTGLGGAVPVPVAAQPLDLDEIREIHQDWETGLAACPRPDGPCIKCQLRANDAAKRIPALLAEVYQLRAELAAVDLAAASLEPAPRWGAGPLVDHNPETPAIEHEGAQQ
jgi:hypothetical protein